MAGDPARAQAVAGEAAKLHPTDTILNERELPLVRAEIAIARGNGAEAVEALRSTARFEPTSLGIPLWRGMAYLQMKSGKEAAAEFQKVLDHKGIFPLASAHWAARVGLARAYALAGDTAAARKAYQDFFAQWKDADPDVPVLLQAKAEYAKLK